MTTTTTVHCCNNTPVERDWSEFEHINGLLAYRCGCGDTVFVTVEQVTSWDADLAEERRIDSYNFPMSKEGM